MCTPCVLSRQKRSSDPLELQVVVSVDARNSVLCKSSSTLD